MSVRVFLLLILPQCTFITLTVKVFFYRFSKVACQCFQNFSGFVIKSRLQTIIIIFHIDKGYGSAPINVSVYSKRKPTKIHLYIAFYELMIFSDSHIATKVWRNTFFYVFCWPCIEPGTFLIQDIICKTDHHDSELYLSIRI